MKTAINLYLQVCTVAKRRKCLNFMMKTKMTMKLGVHHKTKISFFTKDTGRLRIAKFPSLLQHYGSYSFLIKMEGSFSVLGMKLVLRMKCKGVLVWVLLRVCFI